MRSYSVMPSILLWLALLQFGSFAGGFSIPTAKQKWSCRSHVATSTRSPTDIAGYDAIAVKAQQETASETVQGTNQLVPFLKGQRVVFWTSLVVAIATIVTRSVPCQTLRRNMVAGTLIFMAGDWGAQLLTYFKTNSEQGVFLLDNNRFIISSILGSLWAGIANPSVYAGVEHFLPGASNAGRVLLKMAISCSILSTGGNYVTMLFRRVVKQLLETKKTFLQIIQNCVQSCNKDFMEVLKDDLKVWPLYDIICYSLIPPRVRPISNAFMASAWSMYMSIASAKTTNATQKAEAAHDEAVPKEVSEEVQKLLDSGESIARPHLSS